MSEKDKKQLIIRKDVAMCNVRIPLDTTSNQTITIEDLGDYIFRYENKMYYGICQLIELIQSLPYNTNIEVITKDGYGRSDIKAKDQQRKREKVVEELIFFIDTILCPDPDLGFVQQERELYHKLAQNTFNIKTDNIIKIINKLIDTDSFNYHQYKEKKQHLLKQMKEKDF